MIGAKVKVGATVGLAVREGNGVQVGGKVEVGDKVAVYNVAMAVAVPADTAVIDSENSAIDVLISAIDKVGTDSTVGLPAPTNVPIGSKGFSEPESNCG